MPSGNDASVPSGRPPLITSTYKDRLVHLTRERQPSATAEVGGSSPPRPTRSTDRTGSEPALVMPLPGARWSPVPHLLGHPTGHRRGTDSADQTALGGHRRTR